LLLVQIVEVAAQHTTYGGAEAEGSIKKNMKYGNLDKG